MTKVTFFKKEGKITAIECKGHTGYAERGEDIVCASLSSIVQTAVLGILQVAGIKADYAVDEAEGYLKLTLPGALIAGARHDADVILNTLLLGVSDLYEGFSDFIELEVK